MGPSQLGGRKQRSAIDAVMLLQHFVQKCKAEQKGCITSTVFLDIKGAFDYVSRPVLLEILRKLGLPAALCRWVAAFLTERRIQLAFDGRL